MLEGLYSAAAGMAAQQQRIDAVANDLANANTTGYKRVRVGFRDLLYTQAGRPPARASRTGARRRRRVSSAARSTRARFSRPTSRSTSRIQGEGFLQVKLADGATR